VNVSTGKNSTDIALAVDAIDLVISERPDVVVLVSSDSDFAPLVIRLREKGCRVEGIGQEGKTADDSKLVYDRFVDIEHRRAGASSRSTGNADAPVRKAAPRGRARAMAVEPAAPVAAQAATPAPATTPARQARQPRAPREVAKETVREEARSRPPAASPAAAPSRAVQPSGTQSASRRPTLPDDLARIMNVLPELSEGEPVRLALVAERLRSAGLVAKTAPSTKLFKKYPDWFLLTPDRQPHTVQYRGTANS
jgi:hypothetical protein